jgi:hypothetical protein
MKLVDFFRPSERPTNIPADAGRFWPLVEVVSFVTLLCKPLILGVVLAVWWAGQDFGLPFGIGFAIAAVLSIIVLAPFYPAMRRVYWDTQILQSEETRKRRALRAQRLAAVRQRAPNAT